jgi:signal transduction histidine kinase
LTVEDTGPGFGAERPASLAGAGGGNGLAAMRERVERVGGSLHAGPVAAGWRVELEVPA